MSISLSALAEKIGLQRRRIAELVDEREKLLASIDAGEKEIDTLSALQTRTEDQDKKLTELTASTKKSWDDVRTSADKVRQAEAELTDLNQKYELAQEHNRQRERVNESAGRPINGAGGTMTGSLSGDIRSVALTTEQIDHDLATMVRCCVLGRGNRSEMASLARSQFQNDRVAAAMEAGNFSAGGSLVPTQYMPRVIGLLSARAIVRGWGVPSVPVIGQLEMSKITSGSVAAYTGEGQDTNAQQLGTGDVKLTPKEMIAIVASSNKLLGTAGVAVDRIILDDLIRGIALCEDDHFIRGAASGAGPTGMRYLAVAANVIAANATVNATNVEADIAKLPLALENANVGMTNVHWGMSPRVATFLSNLRDANGNKIFPEMSDGMLRGFPVSKTTRIPNNLGAGTASEIYLADADELVIGDNPTMSLDSSNVAAYVENGVVVSAFARNQSVFRVVMENDFNARHQEAIAVLTGVTWGA